MKAFTIKAEISNLSQVQESLSEWLDSVDCPMKPSLQIQMAVEEVFVNISSYAYEHKQGEMTLSFDYQPELFLIRIAFKDQGVPFDPSVNLEKEESSTSLKIEERSEGGLGILMVYKLMDQVTYSYEDGHNILILEKKL